MYTLQTTLMISVAQIIEGEDACRYCNQVACVTVSTGADLAPEPMCWNHARDMIGVTCRLAEHLWNPHEAA